MILSIVKLVFLKKESSLSDFMNQLGMTGKCLWVDKKIFLVY
jgi:hypothetical protein